VSMGSTLEQGQSPENKRNESYTVLWQETFYGMKHVCITGISGYLGWRLAERLIESYELDTLLGIDIVEPKAALDHIKFHKMDIRDPRLGELLRRYEIDTVFHLAFVVKPVHNLKLMYDIDYKGTSNMLKKSYEAGVGHIVAISSTLAYGAHKDNPSRLKEDDPLRGNRSFPYAYHKAIVDNLIQGFAKKHPDMRITTLRPCTIFGPHVNNYVSRMLFMPFTVSLRGYNPQVQFLHEDDFIDVCLLAVQKELGGVFNTAGVGTLAVHDIARLTGVRLIPVPAWVLYPLLESLWRLHMPGIEVNSGYLAYVRYTFVADINKAKDLLGFQPRYSSIETLKHTIRSRKGD